jgi:RNA-directed DNA polymerase
MTPTKERPKVAYVKPTLANITLDGLEHVLAPWTNTNTKKGRMAKVHFARYADDFIITASSPELLKDEILPVIKAFFAPRGLTLSPEKTLITHVSEGFDFLGQNIRSYNGKVLTKPSKKSIHSLLKKVRTIIKDNNANSAFNLVNILNPVIQGWANYHRHACSKDIFAQVDASIFKRLWQWSKRRHRDKSRHWIANKYFGTIGGRHWRFFGETRIVKGEPRTRNWLKLAAQTTIVRHIKIRKDANPYDPADAEYFAQRKKMLRESRMGKSIQDYDGTNCDGLGQFLRTKNKVTATAPTTNRSGV